MLGSLKTVLVSSGVVAGAAVICPLCVPDSAGAVGARSAAAVAPAGGIPMSSQGAQVPDTASLRMHISGMTCATCPVTARAALSRVPGVFSAKVTLDDSLGVVWYDPRRATPERIAGELTRLTGYKARILADSGATQRKPAQR